MSVGALLDEFARRTTEGFGGISGTRHFPPRGAPDDVSLGREPPHAVLGFITHGNEWGTLPAALLLQDELARGAIEQRGPITLLLGNPEAALRDVRFVEEDFNRVFTFDRPATTLERMRAEEVRPLLDSADYFIDFHQTQTPTEAAFWTFPWVSDLPLWARAIGGAPLGLTRRAGGAFAAGKCCLDEYVRARGKMGITLEVGTKGPDPAQAELTYHAARRFLRAVYEMCVDEPADGSEPKGATARTNLRRLAHSQPAITWYETREVVPAETPQHRLRSGLGNWTTVRAGELLSDPDSPEIRASADGRILFPKYPASHEPPPAELFRLGVQVEDPAALFGQV